MPFTLTNEEILEAIDAMDADQIQQLKEEFIARYRVVVPLSIFKEVEIIESENEIIPKTVVVWLLNAGPNKITVIKFVREVTGLGLKDAKDLVDDAPTKLRANLNYDAAQQMVEQLKALSAEAELREV